MWRLRIDYKTVKAIPILLLWINGKTRVQKTTLKMKRWLAIMLEPRGRAEDKKQIVAKISM